jgi:hypothetical protein
VARLGDGWLASAYNTTPSRLAAARATLPDLPCALATMWMYVTDDPRDRDARLAALAAMLNRPVDELAGRCLVGPAVHCATVVRAYADAGVDELFVWPLADPERQLEVFMADVAPLISR